MNFKEKKQQEKISYIAKGNIEVTRMKSTLQDGYDIEEISKKLESKKGAIFLSDYEYPMRYSRWEISFIDPCLELRCFQRRFLIRALNDRGDILISSIQDKIKEMEEVVILEESDIFISGEMKESETFFYEEERSKQSTVFLLIRKMKEIFASDEDDTLGLYGAFGYDLVFQFESAIKYKKQRSENAEDLVLYFPDQFMIKDYKLSQEYILSYEFKTNRGSTVGLIREERKSGNKVLSPNLEKITSKPGDYAEMVRKAIEAFKKGDLFEAVPSHVLSKEISISPQEIFLNLKKINPSPYSFFINLGHEFLIGASPEMYVRVEGNKVETCPISGTIKRGKNVIEDAQQIKKLLNSSKDEAELTMCTDVDRNDKSRVCIPGSVKVLGRRQIELYSHLIHTVDHVEGYLAPGFDSIDAFLTHMWAVTVTGAPKRAAIEWIEEIEKTPRGWYGGAVGYMKFNGDMNTGLTLRTVRVKEDIAQIRVGATLLIHSNPEEEEEETYTKAAALLESVTRRNFENENEKQKQQSFDVCREKKILIIDHEDSFVHTLGNYIKQMGANVMTLRNELAKKMLKESTVIDAVILSPGPGKPERFLMNEIIELCISNNIPILGVCLGMQGLVEYFGGELGQLSNPRHGRSLKVKTDHSAVWRGISDYFDVGLYHSIYCKEIPDCVHVIAKDEEGVPMAIQHKKLPIIAVQFHPESILTSQNDHGLRLLNNIFNELLRYNEGLLTTH